MPHQKFFLSNKARFATKKNNNTNFSGVVLLPQTKKEKRLLMPLPQHNHGNNNHNYHNNSNNSVNRNVT
jgi:hypothetical protein